MSRIECPTPAQPAVCQESREPNPPLYKRARFLRADGRRRALSLAALAVLTAACLLTPPTWAGAQTPDDSAPPAAEAAESVNVILLKDVPMGQPINVSRVLFDLEGYQIITQSGDTIAVPFVNHNLDVMRFGRSASEQAYFMNETESPTLYMPAKYSLENAADAGARWYPLPPAYSDSRPSYVSMVPTWDDYSAMNWYPNMAYYGGLGGFTTDRMALIPNSYVSIAGQRYTSYTYRQYYARRPGFRSTSLFNYYLPASQRIGIKPGLKTGSMLVPVNIPSSNNAAYSPPVGQTAPLPARPVFHSSTPPVQHVMPPVQRHAAQSVPQQRSASLHPAPHPAPPAQRIVPPQRSAPVFHAPPPTPHPAPHPAPRPAPHPAPRPPRR